MARQWGKVTEATVLASLTDEWLCIAALAKILDAKHAAVAYRCRMMAGDELIEASQLPRNGGLVPMNVYRLKQPAVQSAAS